MRLRWGARRRLHGFLDELRASADALRQGETYEWKGTRGRPKTDARVTVNDEAISVATDACVIETVRWSALGRVELHVTGGVVATDDYWLLEDDQGGCVVPSSSAAASTLLDRLQKLPDFDNGVLIEAMSTSAPGVFVCWQRGGHT